MQTGARGDRVVLVGLHLFEIVLPLLVCILIWINFLLFLLCLSLDVDQWLALEFDRSVSALLACLSESLLRLLCIEIYVFLRVWSRAFLRLWSIFSIF